MASLLAERLNRAELVGVQLTPLAGAEIAERNRTDGNADQPQGRVTDGGRHTPHLAVAPLADGEAEPRGRHVLAEPDRHGSIRQRGRRGHHFDVGRASPAVIQDDAAAQGLECLGIRFPLDLDQISFGMFEPRVGEAMRQSSVVGQEEQAFAVAVEPACRIDSLHRDEFLERKTCAGVAKLTEDIVGLE
jgi:hypothetical protein